MIKLYITLEDLLENKISNSSITYPLDKKIIDLKTEFGLNNSCFINCMHINEILNDGTTLVDINLHDGSLLRLIKGRNIKNEVISNNNENLKDILKKFKAIKHQKQDILKQMILDEIGGIIDLNDSINHDLIPYLIATDPRLLRELFSSKENVVKVLEKYPQLIPITYSTINKIYNQINVSRGQPINVDTNRYYSIDEVEESDSSNTEDESDHDDSMNVTESSTSSQINRQSLSEAISNALRPSQQISNMQSIHNVDRQQRISQTQFREALRNATTPVGPIQPQNIHQSAEQTGASNEMMNVCDETSTDSNNGIDSKVQQIVSMGICDEQQARIALEASHGNIHRAIEFLLH